ncbi:MAG: DUF167 domain-containing protein [Chloroflexi bacterium]|nr:DUF167 domain-containing protein [Chloroflexota bacterium]
MTVRLTPRGGRDGVDGADAEGRLRVRVAAPPVDGAANESLIRLLARELGTGRSSVMLVGGATSREKRLWVGVSVDVVRVRWPGVVAEASAAPR